MNSFYRGKVWTTFTKNKEGSKGRGGMKRALTNGKAYIKTSPKAPLESQQKIRTSKCLLKK
jgi:hypothetical protein